MIKYFVTKNFRDTCSSVEMVKGYMLICRNAVGAHGQRKAGNPFPSRGSLIKLQQFICTVRSE